MIYKKTPANTGVFKSRHTQGGFDRPRRSQATLPNLQANLPQKLSINDGTGVVVKYHSPVTYRTTPQVLQAKLVSINGEII